MTHRAWALILTIFFASLMLIAFGVINAPPPPYPYLTLAALGLLGVLASSLGSSDVLRLRLQYETIFFFAGLFLLPFWMFALLVTAVLLAARNGRGALHSDPAGMCAAIAVEIVAGGCAFAVLTGFASAASGPLASQDFPSIIGAGLAYAVVRQVLSGLMDHLVRGVSWNEPATLRNIFLRDLPMTCLGYSAVLSWNFNPWMMLLVLAPLVLIYQVAYHFGRQERGLEQVEEQYRALALSNSALQNLNSDLFHTMAQVFDARDPYVGGHTAQVSAYAVAIARELRLPQERIESLRQAGYLHDIGKIAVPESILHKAGPLTQDEYRLVQRHTVVGEDLIRNCAGLRHLAPFVRSHHERWDGLGYPDGLHGADIALEARILNLCDSVESMTEDMPYHRALSAQEVIEELQRCRGTQFDPILTDTFVAIILREGPQFLVNPAHGISTRLGAFAGDAVLHKVEVTL